MIQKRIIIRLLLGILLAICTTIASFSQELIISEIVASNSSGITDSQGDTPDWIELYNAGTSNIILSDYTLSDNSTIPEMWLFPNDTLAPGEYLLLFANGINQSIDTPVTSFYETILDFGDEMQYILPVVEPNTGWNENGFDTTGWQTGYCSFGYGDDDDLTIVETNISLYIRKEITITNLDKVATCIFNIDYDDGFVAYINGIEIAREGLTGTPPPFDAIADGHEAQLYQGLPMNEYIIPNFADILIEGTNTIAIQIHNQSATSSDMSAIPFLTLEYTEKPPNARGISEFLTYGNKSTDTIPFVNFKIGSKTDTIFLYKNNVLVDKIIIKDIPTDISQGRVNNNTDTSFYFTTTTPGYANANEYYPAQTLPKPSFSHDEGVYSYAFALKMGTSVQDAIIRYTTDGSDPTENSPIYASVIGIEDNSNIKARLFKNGYLPGKIKTESYIFYEREQTLPIVSITAKHSDFFDWNTGIYVEGPNAEIADPHYGANYWEPWEKPIHIELFEPDGTTGFSVNAGTKIAGNWSRMQAQKSLGIYARSQYGDASIDYQVFKDKAITEFQTLVLRNSGNDFNNTMMRDGMIQSLIRNIGIERMAYRPSIVYINGEYFGIMNLREKTNEHFIASNCGVNPDSISIINGRNEVKHGVIDEYNELFYYIENNDLSIPENYEVVSNQLDIQNFIDYFNMEIFIVNEDWPGNNNKIWKENGKGKWRYIVYDTDFGFGTWDISKPYRNMIEFATEPNGPDWPNPSWSTLFLRKLLANDNFKNQFLNSMADRLNTTYQPDSINKHIDSLWNAIKVELVYHAQRWPDESGNNPYDYYVQNIEEMHFFADKRPSVVRENYENYFETGGSYNVNISCSETKAGRIKLNSIMLNSFPWNGSYFNDIPITLTAIPKPGYTFSHWEGAISSTEATISGSFADAITLLAVFDYDSAIDPDITITEINYNSSKEHASNDWIELYNAKQTSQNISGWIIKDSQAFHSFTIPQNTIIPPQSYIVIVRDSLQFSSVYPGIANYTGELSFDLSNQGESIYLYDTLYNLIDKVDYDDQTPWSYKPDGYGYTLQLNNVSDDNSISLNWNAYKFLGTPGEENSPILQNPNRFDIVINEINYNSHENSNSGDWIELYNSGDAAIDISNWVINDNNPDNVYIFPENTVIQSNSYLVLVQNTEKFGLIFPDITDTLHINFGLKNTGDEIMLFDEYESLVDKVKFSAYSPWPIKANGLGHTLSLISPTLDNNISYSWYQSVLRGTPGALNELDTSSNPVIDNIPEIVNAHSSVYPTLFNNQFTIVVETNSIIKIVNSLGRVIDCFSSDSPVLYDSKELINGIYIVYIENNTSSAVFKITKSTHAIE